MKQNLGSKDGKNNRRLFFLNRKRKIRVEEQEVIEKQTKDELVKKEKEKQLILDQSAKDNVDVEVVKESKTTAKSKQVPPTTIIEKVQEENNIHNKNDSNKEPKIHQDENIIYGKPNNKKKTVESNSVNDLNIDAPTLSNKRSKQLSKDTDYFEKQILKILDQQIDENNYQLKKMDSEMHTIEKEIDSLINKEDVEEFENEIQLLIEKLNYIKRQISSLQKTFEFNFPVEEPDNYLIYLVDEFKDKVKSNILLSNKLKENKEYKSILDRIVEIEEKQELLLEKVNEKKDQLNLDNEQVEKMNNDVVDIEDMKKKIEHMLSVQTNLLNEIKIKVNETVHITERVDYITKSVNHSILELFLLMSILKHNLSIKNSVIAAVSAKIALDMIMKMTTPTKEKVVTKVSDVNNYEDLINSCLSDTGKLEKLMDENLNSISSIRYAFEHDYKECSYLPSYKETLDKIYSLEEEMKTKKVEIIKMKKETELQLEKNNTKVIRYGSLV